MSPAPRKTSIILGSTSPWRRQLLEQLGMPFDCRAPDFDESTVEYADPVATALRRAHGKADSLLHSIPANTILITSDQVVRAAGKRRDKPRSVEECREYLSSYTPDSPAETITAVVVTQSVTNRRWEGVDIATQYFNPLPVTVIEQVIEEGSVMNCAGGFRIDHPLFTPYLLRREGSADSIMGMPLQLTQQLLLRAMQSITAPLD